MEYRMLFQGLAVAASSVVFLGAAMLLCGVLRSRSAAFRHFVLFGAFAGLFILPVLSIALPTWSLPDSPAMPAHGPGGQRATSWELRTVAAELGALPQAGTSLSQATNARPAEPKSPGVFDRALWTGLWEMFLPYCPLVAVALWALGALAVIVVQIVRWTAAGFIAEMAVLVENDPVRSLADRIQWELGLAKRPRLLRSDIAPVSMVCGVRRPCIVLPAEHVEWPLDKTEAVLRHELAHVKRHDNLFHLIAGLACAIYWLNPLVWAAMRRLHFEREVACDDCVLEAGTAASAYAKHLMEVSMKLSGPKSMRIVPAAMAHSSDVKRRLLHVLDPAMRRRPAGAGSALIAILLVACIAVPVSAFRIWSDEKPVPPAPPVSPAPVTQPVEPVAQAPAPSPAPPAAFSQAATPAAPAAWAVAPSASAPPAEDSAVDVVLSGNERTWEIDGTVRIKDERVDVDGTMRNSGKNLTIDAAHVIFEPGLPDGFRFDSRRGSLVVKETRGTDELVWKARPKGGLDEIDVSLTVNGKPKELDAKSRGELKAIAEEIYESLGDTAELSLSSLSSARKGLETERLLLLGKKDLLIARIDSLDRAGLLVPRSGKEHDIMIVRAHAEADKLAREYERAVREVDRSTARSAREIDRANARMSREFGRAVARANARVDSLSDEEMRVYYLHARGADEMESVIDLFEDQQEAVIDAMGRLEGDAREEYRDAVVSSYEKMISRLDERIAELKERDSTDPSVERKIEQNVKLRDSLSETVAKVKSM